MTFLELAKQRYSVRSFKNQQISDDDLSKILEIVKYAPTAKNNQPQKIYVIQSKENIEKINSLSKCIYNAPTVIVIGYDKDLDWKNKRRGEYSSGEMDTSIVLTHIMLQAYEIGVGSVWVGMFNDEEVRVALDIPSNIQITALLPIGYISEESKPIQMHYDTRNDEEMIKII